jgi:heptosyltransferase III
MSGGIQQKLWKKYMNKLSKADPETCVSGEWRSSVKKIVIFRSGLLGDTLVGLPALWCLKEHFPHAQLVYIWQKVPNVRYVTARDVLSGSGIIDEFIVDELASSKFKRLFHILRLLGKVKKEKADIGVVLEAPFWSSKRRWFLKVCGVKKVVSWDERSSRIQRNQDGEMVQVDHISDQLLVLLQQLGISGPDRQTGKMEFPLRKNELNRIDAWLGKKEIRIKEKFLIAVAPWSNMPLKRWPLENFERIVKRLIAECNVCPIIFGGREEQGIGIELVRSWGTGVVAAGELNIREGIGVMRHCRFFLGNDTGVMHMAVASGIPCVAVFSARDNVGLWEPYGVQHTVVRRRIECEGCLLRECSVRDMECIKAIGIDEVFESCLGYLNPEQLEEER